VRSIRGERPIDVRLQLGQVDLDQLIVLCALIRLQVLLHGPHNHVEFSCDGWNHRSWLA